MTFEKPATSSEDRFAPADHLGSTVAFYGITKDTITTQHGDATVAHCDVAVVLDHPEGAKAYTDVLVFGAALAPSLYRAAPGPVLGIIGQGEAKPGRSAPWILEEADETRTTAANEWHKKGLVTKQGDQWVYAPDTAPF